MSTTPPGDQPPGQPEHPQPGRTEPPPAGWQTSGAPPPQPPYPYGGQPPQPQWAPAATAPTNGKAIAALVTGIASFVTCLLPIGIAALILGYMGRNEIDRSGGAQQGRGLAVAGIIMGWVAIALMVLGVIFFALFFGAIASSNQFR